MNAAPGVSIHGSMPGACLDPAASRAPVIVFGECLVDRFGASAVAGGAPFNVARHLAAFGLDPYFVTRIGSDPTGALLARDMAAFGVRRDGVQVDAQRASGEVIVRRGAQGHAFEILPDRAYDHIAPVQPPPWPARPLPWLYFGTLIQRGPDSRASLEALRRDMPHRAFVDLNWRDGQVGVDIALAMLDAADVLKLGSEELGLLLSWRSQRSPFSEALPAMGARCAAVGQLFTGHRLGRLLVTHGAAGYALWEAPGLCTLAGSGVRQPALVDTVGAGDAFSAIVLAGLLLGWPLPLALERANAFAAAICGIRGAACADAGFYAAWAQRWQGPA